MKTLLVIVVQLFDSLRILLIHNKLIFVPEFVYRSDVDDLRKKKLQRKFNFLNSYLSDGGKLSLFDND